MWVLFSAVLLASLLGSTHCVGMCGPLALWATGATEKKPGNVTVNTTFYHFGRLLTYVLMGLIAGVIGELVNLGGETLGLRMMAARVVGVMMVVMGLWQLATFLPSRSTQVASGNTPKPSLITRLLIRVRPFIFKLPRSARALATGLLTAFLPCGWLYVFAFVSAGTASAFNGAIVMTAFWIGTVPLLTGLVISANLINAKFQMIVPITVSILLVVTGVYTACGNGFASPDALANLQSIAAEKQVSDLADASLPCCCNGEKKCESP